VSTPAQADAIALRDAVEFGRSVLVSTKLLSAVDLMRLEHTSSPSFYPGMSGDKKEWLVTFSGRYKPAYSETGFIADWGGLVIDQDGQVRGSYSGIGSISPWLRAA
jgi:hypothetical protein